VPYHRGPPCRRHCDARQALPRLSHQAADAQVMVTSSGWRANACGTEPMDDPNERTDSSLASRLVRRDDDGANVWVVIGGRRLLDAVTPHPPIE